jgi:hypothetical protein
VDTLALLLMQKGFVEFTRGLKGVRGTGERASGEASGGASGAREGVRGGVRGVRGGVIGDARGHRTNGWNEKGIAESRRAGGLRWNPNWLPATIGVLALVLALGGF